MRTGHKKKLFQTFVYKKTKESQLKSCCTSLLQLDQLSRAGQAFYQRIFRIPRLSSIALLIESLILFSNFIMCSLLFLLPPVSTPITWLLLKALPRICSRTQTTVGWHRCWDPFPFAFLQLTAIDCRSQSWTSFAVFCLLFSFSRHVRTCIIFHLSLAIVVNIDVFSFVLFLFFSFLNFRV